MPKVNVYLPSDLHAAVMSADMNLSAFVQDMLRIFLEDRLPGEYAARGLVGKARQQTQAATR